VNLLPNYASVGQLGASTYLQYVEEFAALGPDMLCVDHYPEFGPGSAVSDSNLTMAGV
jgi:hypothetical protein